MFLVLEFLMPFVLLVVESIVFGRRLRNIFGENETEIELSGISLW
jgi:ABC-type xylose transport system permease subunit